jgi:preprotein translocase subunit SecD
VKSGRHVASVLIILALAGSAVFGFLAWNLRPLLGLDLVGGVSAVLTAPQGTPPEVLDRTVETIRNRVDAFGVAEPDITRQGDLNIQVQIPEVEEEATGERQQRLLELIGRTAQLEFRLAEETLVPGTEEYGEVEITEDPGEEGDIILPEAGAPEDGEPTLYRLGELLMTGDRLNRAVATIDDGGGTGVPQGWQVSFELDSQGARQFAEITRENVGQQLAIVLDERVESAPTIQDEIPGGSGVITGDFSEQEAKDLATVLQAGALPVELTRSQVQTVSPTLGAESLRQGLWAGAAGLLLLAIYLAFYYRLLGVATWLGMAVWAALVIALISLLGMTWGYSLTLAGIAGVIVSIGIAADSNIVFYERLKDEIRTGKTLRAAVTPAFNRAWRTIIAADIVTISAAVILYLLAIGSVRGFALTLGLATALDMIVVYFFVRPAVFLVARSRLAELPFFGLRSAVGAEDLKPPAPEPVRGGSK